MAGGRPKIAERLKRTNLTLDKLIKEAAMKLATARRQSLSALVTELLDRELRTIPADLDSSANGDGK
jgi:hypothetical protein